MRSALAILLILAAAGFARPAPAPDPTPRAAYDAQSFREELGRVLATHFNSEGELEVELLRPWTPPPGTASDWQVVVTEFPGILSGTMMVRLRIAADGIPGEEASLVVRASLWRDVWFARQPVSAGTIFSPGLLDTRRVDCLRTHDALPASAGDRSLIFARDVGADRMLTWHDLTRRPLVRKGDLVEASGQEGQLLVSMKAVALENGARGDMVLLRNVESHNEISGQVVDDGRVQIRF
jgi:flagella basal body P-ring formation protein FlgA